MNVNALVYFLFIDGLEQSANQAGDHGGLSSASN